MGYFERQLLDFCFPFLLCNLFTTHSKEDVTKLFQQTDN